MSARLKMERVLNDAAPPDAGGHHMANAAEVARRLDAATNDHRLLEHPFYKAWAAGELTRDDLRFYSTQYWRQVEAFPGYLAVLKDRLDPGAARDVVAENLSDEIDGDHLGLWLDFAGGMGASAEEVKGSAPEPETTECVDAFRAASTGRSKAFVLGMLYGYESQTPGVAQTKIQGLRDHYGVADAAALEYFRLHGELDVHHAGELATAIADLPGDEETLDEAEAGARAGAVAIWKLLDGVARARNISCN